MKCAAVAKSLGSRARDVVSIPEQRCIKYAGRLGTELCRKSLFQTRPPFVKPRQGKKDLLVIETFNQQRALDHAGRIEAFALKILGERQCARSEERRVGKEG